jgi:hypothetical protein
MLLYGFVATDNAYPGSALGSEHLFSVFEVTRLLEIGAPP